MNWVTESLSLSMKLEEKRLSELTSALKIKGSSDMHARAGISKSTDFKSITDMGLLPVEANLDTSLVGNHGVQECL
jgi:hypothetical protein